MRGTFDDSTGTLRALGLFVKGRKQTRRKARECESFAFVWVWWLCGGLGAPHRHKGKSPVGASAGKPHLLAKCFDRLIYTDKFRIGRAAGDVNGLGKGAEWGRKWWGSAALKAVFLFLKIDISPKKSA